MSPELLDRIPPCDEAAERAIVGCIVVNSRIVDDLLEVVSANWFYTEAARVFVGRVAAMSNAGQRITTDTIVDALNEHDELDRVGGAAYLGDVAHVLSLDWKYYAEKVRRMYELRQTIDVSLRAVRDAYELHDPSEVIEAAETGLAAIGDGRQVEALITAERAAADAIVEIDRAVQNRGSLGCPTGFTKFDQNVGGLFGGQLIVLASRPGRGKSALASQIAHFNGAAGRRVIYVSLEMTGAEIALRSVCGLAGVSSRLVKTGRIDADQSARLSEAAAEFGGAKIHFDCRPRQTVASIRRQTRRLKRQGLDLIVVDYLQLLTPADPRVKRYEAVGQMTADLKRLAMELGLPVLCLAQLSRESEKDGKPRLRHLRESGSIEQDADVVMLLDRPEAGIEINKTRVADATLDVAKNRCGEDGVFHLNFDGPSTTFSEVDVPADQSKPMRQARKYSEFEEYER